MLGAVAVALLFLGPSVTAFVAVPHARPHVAVARRGSSTVLASVEVLAGADDVFATTSAFSADLLSDLTSWQTSHTFLYGILVAIVTRLIINEIRFRIEKPVMDEAGRRVKEQLMPDQTQATAPDIPRAPRVLAEQWPMLAYLR